MFSSELIAQLRQLSRAEKLQVIQLLAIELALEVPGVDSAPDPMPRQTLDVSTRPAPQTHLERSLVQSGTIVSQPNASGSQQTVGDAKDVEGGLRSQLIQLQNFLPPQDHQNLLEYVLQQEPAFVSSTTSTGDSSYRQSQVLHSFPAFSDLIASRLHEVLPQVLDAFGVPEFQVSNIESQLTAHNDGHYYRVHNDNGSPDTARRLLTYVYYFYCQPKAFKGGELRIYDSKIENQHYVAAETYQDVFPIDNSVVFFLSRYLHEVLPVVCPTGTFMDSRFTINGWIWGD